jgi:hypothetical protein
MMFTHDLADARAGLLRLLVLRGLREEVRRAAALSITGLCCWYPCSIPSPPTPMRLMKRVKSSIGGPC